MSIPLVSPEGIFDFYEGIRIRRPFLGLTRECVGNVCRETARNLSVEVSDEYPDDIRRVRDAAHRSHEQRESVL